MHTDPLPADHAPLSDAGATVAPTDVKICESPRKGKPMSTPASSSVAERIEQWILFVHRKPVIGDRDLAAFYGMTRLPEQGGSAEFLYGLHERCDRPCLRQLASNLAELEKQREGHDETIIELFEAIRQLIEPDAPRHGRKIGFHDGER